MFNKHYPYRIILLVLVLLILPSVWYFYPDNPFSSSSPISQSNTVGSAPFGFGRDHAHQVPIEKPGPVNPIFVDLATIPPGLYDPNNKFDRMQRGEWIPGEREYIRPEAEIKKLKAIAKSMAHTKNVQIAEVQSGPQALTPSATAGFDSIDYRQCCGGGGNVPPDPELAVGPDHIIAVVNVAFEIFDKSGAVLIPPTTLSSFFNADPNCQGVFDPNALYDEEADRFIIGVDADGSHYCIAVTQTGDPTGGWNLYSFPTIDTATEFFDYPHAGVGRDAIYMGANIFGVVTFKESRIWAFDKNAMYTGSTATAVRQNLGQSHDTPQPLNLHGYLDGTWPGSGPHYIFVETNYNGRDHTVFSWNDPFGANTFTTVGSIDLNTASGVTAEMPIDVPQSGSTGKLDGGDWRPQDFEYRDGYAWTSMTIACNPGSGTVDCVRWAKIDPATAAVVDAGVYGSNGEFRTYADLAVNHCGDMAVGYTKSSGTMYPSIYYTGREDGDTPGQLQPEQALKAGEITYTAFDGSTFRWGDYTEMTIDPDGLTFWYLGEYSKNTGTTNGRWGTYIGSFSFASCSAGPVDTRPSITITEPTNPVTGTVAIVADASDDNGVSQVEFFVDGNSVGIDDIIGDGWSAPWDTSSFSDGSHTVTATATDTIGQTGSDTVTVTVDNIADQSAHVVDLDGSSSDAGKGKWNVVVNVSTVDQDDNPIEGALVDGIWGGGANGSSSCTTDASGTCPLTKNSIPNKIGSVTSTVVNVSKAGLIYDPSANNDPDGDSNGTEIVVNKPGSGTTTISSETYHIGDLIGSSSSAQGTKWNATVTVTVHDAAEASAPAGIPVEGAWDVGGTGSCTTDGSGQCGIVKNNIRGNYNAATFSVTNVNGGGSGYDPGSNHVTTLTITRP